MIALEAVGSAGGRTEGPRRALLYVRFRPDSGGLTDAEFESTLDAVNLHLPNITWDEFAHEEEPGTSLWADIRTRLRAEPGRIAVVVHRIDHLAPTRLLLARLGEILSSRSYFFSCSQPHLRWVGPASLRRFEWDLRLLAEFQSAQREAAGGRARRALDEAKARGQRIGRHARDPCACGYRHPLYVRLDAGIKRRLEEPVRRCTHPGCHCREYRSPGRGG